jgi:hypothetical protein
VSRPDSESEYERVWSLLLEAGFFDIPPDEFADRIKTAKHVVIARLSELLQVATEFRERESAACSLATLKKLETIIGRSGKESKSG